MFVNHTILCRAARSLDLLIVSFLLFHPLSPLPPPPTSSTFNYNNFLFRVIYLLLIFVQLMPRNSAQALTTAPLGSTGTTPRPANPLPPRVQTSPSQHVSTHLPIPEVLLPLPATATVPQEEISAPAADTREDLVDHGLINRLLALQPDMSLEQMTDVLNILHPTRHRNAATAAVRRAQSAPIRPPTPLVVPVPTTEPSARPLTGNRITNPQRRVPVASHLHQPGSLLEILNGPSHKRSTNPSFLLSSL